MKPKGTRGSVLRDRVTASELEAGTRQSVQGKRGVWVLGVERGSRKTGRVQLHLGPCGSQ